MRAGPEPGSALDSAALARSHTARSHTARSHTDKDASLLGAPGRARGGDGRHSGKTLNWTRGV